MNDALSKLWMVVESKADGKARETGGRKSPMQTVVSGCVCGGRGGSEKAE